jgi:hypothetical protein
MAEFFGASFIVVFGLYFLPSIVALARGVKNSGSVVIVNIFLGWTLIGWVVALAMAARTEKKSPITPVEPVASNTDTSQTNTSLSNPKTPTQTSFSYLAHEAGQDWAKFKRWISPKR